MNYISKSIYSIYLSLLFTFLAAANFLSISLPVFAIAVIEKPFNGYAHFMEIDFEKSRHQFTNAKYSYMPILRYDKLSNKKLVHGIKLLKGDKVILNSTTDKFDTMSYLYVVLPIRKLLLSKLSDPSDNSQMVFSNGYVRTLPAIFIPNGEKRPIIIIGSYSGGAHCCFSYQCYELDGRAKKMASPESTGNLLTFAYFHEKGQLECIGYDGTYDYWNASHADSPAPTVIQELKDGRWQLALDDMRVEKFGKKDISRAAKTCKSDISSASAVADKKLPDDLFVLPTSVWGVMLNFIYAGRADDAWKFLDDIWIDKKDALIDDLTKDGKRMNKETFKNALKEQIHKSPYFEGLVLLNRGQDL